MLDTRYTSVTVKVVNGVPSVCWMTIQENNDPFQMTDLDINKAHKLMWELKLAGGDRRLEVDDINPKSYIYGVSHMFFWYHH